MPKKIPKKRYEPSDPDPMYCGTSTYGRNHIDWQGTCPKEKVAWAQALVPTTDDSLKFGQHASDYKKNLKGIFYPIKRAATRTWDTI